MESADLTAQATQQALAGWLANRLPAAGGVTLSPVAAATGAGFSAQTYFFEARYDDGGAQRRRPMVLRRQLAGSDLFMDADLGLQAKAMEALARHPSVPAPLLVGVELSSDLLGAPFLVMDRASGRIAPQNPNYNLKGWVAELAPERRFAAWKGAIEAIAEVHKIDWRDGFQFLNQPARGAPGLDQYLDWVEAWFRWAAASREHPTIEAALAYLKANRPTDAPVQVLWGDAIPANTLFAEDGSIAALIDWEMAALGPGEVDLGWWLYFDHAFAEGFGVPRLPGLPDREQTIALYEAAAGRRVADMRYFEVLAALRMAVILIRGVDRQVGLGRFKADNDAWLNNATTLYLAGKLGLPASIGEDFMAYVKLMMPS